MSKGLTISIVISVFAMVANAQRMPPVVGRHLPDPGPNRVEVRFALGETAVQCKRFGLTAKAEGRVIMAGKFKSGFEIPANVAGLPRKDAVELEFKCGQHRWHFNGVGERAFLPGWRWVGTDYPPFQETFQGWSQLEDAVWVRYLIVEPTVESGFTVYKFCPAKLKDQKPGPCYEE